MKSKKTLSILLIAMVLAFVLVPTLALADSFNGSITLTSNNSPTVDVFTVSNISPLDPTTACDISLTVSDADGFANISQVFLVFWYTTTAGDPAGLPNAPAALMSQGLDSQTVHWVEVWDGVDTFTGDTTNTNWVTAAPGSMPTGGETTFFNFQFSVTPGSEAQEVATATDTDKWVIGVLVTDATANTTFALADGTTGTPLSMQWYGEMTAAPEAGPFWTGATANMAYADQPAQIFDATYTLNIVSNGNYTLEVSADTTWVNGDPTTINYDTAVDAADEFSLSVDTQPTYNATGTAQELPNDPGVTGFTDPITIATPAGWGTGTDYAGVGITNIYMYLQTNATMTISASPYEGTVIFTLVNAP